MHIEQLWLSVNEVARLTGISRDKIIRLIEKGQLKAKNTGLGQYRSFYIKRDDLEAYMSSDTGQVVQQWSRRLRRPSAYKPQIVSV